MKVTEFLGALVDSGGARFWRPRVRTHAFWTRENLLSPLMTLVICVIALCAIGLIMIFSASSIEAVEVGLASWSRLASQAVATAVAFIVFAVLINTNGEFWTSNRAIMLAWVATVALLAVVLVAGRESHGATRWIELGPLSLQPSEFAKISVLLAAARIFCERQEGNISLGAFVALMAVFVLFPFAMILLQKDLGTILIIGTTLLLVAILSGVRWWVLLAVVAVAALAVYALINTSGYRRDRLNAWLNPEADYYGDGWQLSHSLFAFATGGFFGVGLGNSPQKYSYLPEAHNDFIYAIIGEELGFIGAIVIVILFVVFGWAGMRIAHAAEGRSKASSLMAAGFTCCILVQALLNMCGVLQLLPLTGRPLPFVSAGGSSILSSMIMVGLIVCVARDNDLQKALDEAVSSRRMRVVTGGATRRGASGRERGMTMSSGGARR